VIADTWQIGLSAARARKGVQLPATQRPAFPTGLAGLCAEGIPTDMSMGTATRSWPSSSPGSPAPSPAGRRAAVAAADPCRSGIESPALDRSFWIRLFVRNVTVTEAGHSGLLIRIRKGRNTTMRGLGTSPPTITLQAPNPHPSPPSHPARCRVPPGRHGLQPQLALTGPRSGSQRPGSPATPSQGGS
jgi:hypothetical protein